MGAGRARACWAERAGTWEQLRDLFSQVPSRRVATQDVNSGAAPSPGRNCGGQRCLRGPAPGCARWRLSECVTSATESLSGERPPCQVVPFSRRRWRSLLQQQAGELAAELRLAGCHSYPWPPREPALGPEAAAQVARPGRRSSCRLRAFPSPPPSLAASVVWCRGRCGVASADSPAFTCKDSSSQWSGARPLPRPPCQAAPMRGASVGGGEEFLIEHPSLEAGMSQPTTGPDISVLCPLKLSGRDLAGAKADVVVYSLQESGSLW